MKNSHHTYIPIEPLIGGLRLGLTTSYYQYDYSIEPLIGGLRPLTHCFQIQNQMEKPIEPLIGGLKCSFAFLERGAVEELFTGVEC